MSYNAKNYTEQGGEVTHIGGKLIFEEGAQVEGLPSSFTPAENQADSTASTVATLKDDFNALLAKLKTAGIVAADPEADLEPGEGSGGGAGDPEEQ